MSDFFKLCKLGTSSEIIEAIRSQGACVNTANVEGFTVLMHSVCEGNFEAADTLIKEGADVNAQD